MKPAVALLLALTFALPAGDASEPRVATDDYRASMTNDCVLGRGGEILLGPPGAGLTRPLDAAAACLAIEPGETVVTLAFADDGAATAIGFWYSFGGAARGIACYTGEDVTLGIPAGATVLDLVVYPQSPGCSDVPATTGLARATFG